MSDRYFPESWPLPALTEHNREFFTRGAVVVQRCENCAAVQHPPLDLCMSCQGMEFSYVESTGLGTVDSWTTVHHASDRRLASLVPYNVSLVRLEDHPDVLVVGNIVNAQPSAVRIGAAVRCTFARVEDPELGETLMLPQWELVP